MSVVIAIQVPLIINSGIAPTWEYVRERCGYIIKSEEEFKFIHDHLSCLEAKNLHQMESVVVEFSDVAADGDFGRAATRQGQHQGRRQNRVHLAAAVGLLGVRSSKHRLRTALRRWQVQQGGSRVRFKTGNLTSIGFKVHQLIVHGWFLPSNSRVILVNMLSFFCQWL